MINALSIDLEFWWNSEFLRNITIDKSQDFILESITPLLNLLQKHNVKATFFVLGEVAQKYPELIKLIHKQGHEIANHGWSHEPLTRLTKEKFEGEVRKSTKLLEKITGEKPTGFRTACFSLNQETIWAIDILEKYGYKYDSSILPIKSKYYGTPNAPTTRYRPSKKDITQHDPNGKLVELPISFFNLLGQQIPLGGFYFRALPYWITRQAMQGKQNVFFIHPKDMHTNIPKLNISFKSKLVTYYGLGTALRKFESLLKDFKFAPIRKVLEESYEIL